MAGFGNDNKHKEEKSELLKISRDIGLTPRDRIEALSIMIWLKLKDDERKEFTAFRAKRPIVTPDAPAPVTEVDTEPVKQALPEHLK